MFLAVVTLDRTYKGARTYNCHEGIQWRLQLELIQLADRMCKAYCIPIISTWLNLYRGPFKVATLNTTAPQVVLKHIVSWKGRGVSLLPFYVIYI